MGFLKDARAGVVSKEARDAADAGSPVFIARLNKRSIDPGLSGGIKDWSRVVAEVEAEGWRLDQWTVGEDAAYPLFRRA